MFCTNLIPKHLGCCVEQIKAGGKHAACVHQVHFLVVQCTSVTFSNDIFYSKWTSRWAVTVLCLFAHLNPRNLRKLHCCRGDVTASDLATQLEHRVTLWQRDSLVGILFKDIFLPVALQNNTPTPEPQPPQHCSPFSRSSVAR